LPYGGCGRVDSVANTTDVSAVPLYEGRIMVYSPQDHSADEHLCQAVGTGLKDGSDCHYGCSQENGLLPTEPFGHDEC
jgi:hypothetical protein